MPETKDSAQASKGKEKQEYTLSVGKITGSPGEQTWSQIHAFIPEDGSKRKSHGSLVAVISLSSQEPTDIASFGKEVILRLHEEYYAKKHPSPLATLKAALKIVDQQMGVDIKLNITAGVFLDNVLYLGIFGSGSVKIQRGPDLATILSSKESSAFASGFLHDGDRVVIATLRFFDIVADGVLKAALQEEEIERAKETLSPIVHGREQNADKAAAIVFFQKQKIVEEEVFRFGSDIPRETKQKRQPLILISLRQRLKKLLAGLSGKRPRLKLRSPSFKKRSKAVRLAGLLLALLVIIVSVRLVVQRKQSQKQAAFDNLCAQAKLKLNEAESLAELNPVRAKSLLGEAAALLEESQSQPAADQQVVDSLRSNLEKVDSLVFRENFFTEAEIFIDLTLIKKDGQGNRLDILGNNLLITDSQNTRLYIANGEKQSAEILTGGEEKLGKILQATLSPQRAFLLTEKGIFQVGLEDKEAEKLADLKDSWRKANDLAFYGGNLYLMLEGGEIFKLPILESSLGKQQDYLAEDQLLESPNAFAIDGAIWVLQKDGQIRKIMRGVEETIVLSGLDKDLKDPKAIYTDENLNDLYVLDWGNMRVVVFSKQGEYQTQYLWPGISGVSDLVVSAPLGKIFLLSDHRIYQLPL